MRVRGNLFSRLGLLFATVFLVGLTAARAGEGGPDPNWEPLDADAMIAACWEEPQKKIDRGSTAHMREGALEAALCIEARIVEQLEEFLDPESSYVKERMPDLQAHIRKIGFSIGELYWALYNEHRYCDGFSQCGVMDSVVHNSAMSGYYERILIDIVQRRISIYKWKNDK